MIINCKCYKECFDSNYEENTHISYIDEIVEVIPSADDNDFIYVFDRNNSSLDSVRCFNHDVRFTSQYSYHRFCKNFTDTYFKDSTTDKKLFARDFEKYYKKAHDTSIKVCNHINRYYSNAIRRIHIDYIYQMINYLEFTNDISRTQYKSVSAYSIKLPDITMTKFIEYNVPYYYSICDDYLKSPLPYKQIHDFNDLYEVLFDNELYESLYTIRLNLIDHVKSQYRRLCNRMFDSLSLIPLIEFTTIDNKKIVVTCHNQHLIFHQIDKNAFVITSDDFSQKAIKKDTAKLPAVEYRDNIEDFIIEAQYYYNNPKHNIHNLTKHFDYDFLDNNLRCYVWDGERNATEPIS